MPGDEGFEFARTAMLGTLGGRYPCNGSQVSCHPLCTCYRDMTDAQSALVLDVCRAWGARFTRFRIEGDEVVIECFDGFAPPRMLPTRAVTVYVGPFGEWHVDWGREL
jgi:hypothetical protein